MDKLIKGNQLITDFLFDENVPFRNKTITDTMKKLLSGFRASGHVTKFLKVTKDEITIKVNDDEFSVVWNDVLNQFYIGISRYDTIDGYLYISENEPKKKTVQTLRDVFGMFRTNLDYRKKEAEFDQKYPDFFTTL
jgi:hypothetical protein